MTSSRDDIEGQSWKQSKVRVSHRASFLETKSRAIWEGHGASFTETKSIIINSKRFPTFLRKRYFGGITQRHFWKQNPDKNFQNDFSLIYFKLREHWQLIWSWKVPSEVARLLLKFRWSWKLSLMLESSDLKLESWNELRKMKLKSWAKQDDYLHQSRWPRTILDGPKVPKWTVPKSVCFLGPSNLILKDHQVLILSAVYFLISGSSTFGDNPALVFWTVQFDT